jgi:hypothetical protein
MKKSFYLLAAAVLLVSSVHSFAQYNKGDKLFNLGLGFNSYFNGGLPLHGSFEVGVTDEISVGASFDYLTYRYRLGGINYGYNSMYIGGRASYHFSELLDLNTPEFDLYGGVALGIRTFGWRGDAVNGLGNMYDNGIYYGLFAGGRYYFEKKIGVFGELGVGYSGNARAGVSFRF